MPPKPGISKKKKIYTSKSSDRRLAAGKRPDIYLHSALNSHKLPLQQTEDWDPKHFRLFVGNLGQDATDDMLVAAFSKYESMSKAKVPADKAGKNKGFGFVAFANAEDYLKAFKEMNGKYVGQRPVQLKRAESKVKAKK